MTTKIIYLTAIFSRWECNALGIWEYVTYYEKQ